MQHGGTLTGDGGAAPLDVAIPLIVSGSVDTGNGVITTTNTASGGPGLFSTGGNSSPTIGGGNGVIALGGASARTSRGSRSPGR